MSSIANTKILSNLVLPDEQYSFSIKYTLLQINEEPEHVGIAV